MGKKTIAEFVESDETFEIGVDYAQGYAIGRPKLFEVAHSSIPDANLDEACLSTPASSARRRG